MSNLVPDVILPYLEYLPDIQKCANFIMTFTPLYTYGSTCYSIHKKRTSVGFSIDICATMLMASILRICYYVISPYEITLLRQSIVMIGIQFILLKVALHYRPNNYDPEFLTPMPLFVLELNNRLPRRLSPYSFQLHQDYFTDNSYVRSWIRMLSDGVEFVSTYSSVIFFHSLNFFDVYYQRPWGFWQWKLEVVYWKFIGSFAGIFGILTMAFNSNEFYGSFIGILGLFIESLLPLPQILLLNRLGSIKNFKSILLLSWLCGDLTKISYLLYGTKNVSNIFIAAGLFQMGLDLIIVWQYVHFWKLDSAAEAAAVSIASSGVYELSDLPNSSSSHLVHVHPFDPALEHQEIKTAN